MKEAPINQLVKREDWQALRKSFLGKWKTKPKENIQKLRDWLGNIQNTEYEKLRIVMNYLTGSGFRTGKIKDSDIQELRNDISKEMRRRKAKGLVTKEGFLEKFHSRGIE